MKTEFLKSLDIIPLFKVVSINVSAYDLKFDANVMTDTTWIELIAECVKNVKLCAQNPHEIVSVAFGIHIHWRPHGKYKFVLDTRDERRSPYNTLENGDILNITMLQRQKSELKWCPMIFALNKCTYCNTMESLTHKLKQCACCKMT